MKIRYFTATDTAYIQFRDTTVLETQDFGEDAVIDLGADGVVCAIALEHASERAGFPNVSIEHMAA